MMKILFATAEYYPTHRADVTVLFGKYLPRYEIYSDLLTLHQTDQPLPPWPGGHLLTQAVRKGRITRHLQGMLNSLKMLRLGRRGYDAIQVRDQAWGAIVGLIAARLAGIRLYYWMSFPLGEAWKVRAGNASLQLGQVTRAITWLRGWAIDMILYRVVLPRADHVFVQSDRMREDVVAHGLRIDRVSAVPMGIDHEERGLMSTHPQPIVDPITRPTFVYLGTLNSVRHPELMLEAIDIVRRHVPDVSLLLIGETDDASDRAWLRAWIQKRNLETHVQLTGWLPADQAWAIAKHCLAGLSPVPRNNLYDVSSPTKVVEYLSLGLPVIANDQPDQAAVMAAFGGTCVAFTAHAFAERMLDVLADPMRYRTQAAHGQRWVRAARSYDSLSKSVAHAYRSTCKPFMQSANIHAARAIDRNAEASHEVSESNRRL